MGSPEFYHNEMIRQRRTECFYAGITKRMLTPKMMAALQAVEEETVIEGVVMDSTKTKSLISFGHKSSKTMIMLENAIEEGEIVSIKIGNRTLVNEKQVFEFFISQGYTKRRR